MKDLKDKIKSIQATYSRGEEIESKLKDIEVAKTDVNVRVQLQIGSYTFIHIDDEIRSSILAIVENDLEEEIEHLYKKLKKYNIEKEAA